MSLVIRRIVFFLYKMLLMYGENIILDILSHNNTKTFAAYLLSITSTRYAEMQMEHPDQMHIFTI